MDRKVFILLAFSGIILLSGLISAVVLADYKTTHSYPFKGTTVTDLDEYNPSLLPWPFNSSDTGIKRVDVSPNEAIVVYGTASNGRRFDFVRLVVLEKFSVQPQIKNYSKDWVGEWVNDGPSVYISDSFISGTHDLGQMRVDLEQEAGGIEFHKFWSTENGLVKYSQAKAKFEEQLKNLDPAVQAAKALEAAKAKSTCSTILECLAELDLKVVKEALKSVDTAKLSASSVASAAAGTASIAKAEVATAEQPPPNAATDSTSSTSTTLATTSPSAEPSTAAAPSPAAAATPAATVPGATPATITPTPSLTPAPEIQPVSTNSIVAGTIQAEGTNAAPITASAAAASSLAKANKAYIISEIAKIRIANKLPPIKENAKASNTAAYLANWAKNKAKTDPDILSKIYWYTPVDGITIQDRVFGPFRIFGISELSTVDRARFSVFKVFDVEGVKESLERLDSLQLADYDLVGVGVAHSDDGKAAYVVVIAIED